LDADLDTLATALYVRTDDAVKSDPSLAPPRPAVGFAPQITDAELVTLAVMQALLGFTSEAKFLRHARTDGRLSGMFVYLPQQSGYNRRLRKLTRLIGWLVRALATETAVVFDDVWLADSTPVETGRSRETVKRSDLAGWAEYGYCASHSRYFWGLRLHLLTTPSGLIIGFVLTGAKADEREMLLAILDDPHLPARAGVQTLIADKNYYGKDFEAILTAGRIHLLRPARKGEAERPGAEFFKPIRQIIESVNATLKTQLDLERHGARTTPGVIIRVWQRLLALNTAIWHNDRIGAEIRRNLTAYDLTAYDH
jgi:hypothetical protein